MIPTRLILKNFMSYRGEVEIDFSGIDLACLSGDNGAGKSALLDAMTWALWGQSRARTDRDLVTLQETEMDVTFEFRIRDHEYRVFRRRSGAANRLTLEFHSRSADGDDWHAVTGDNASDTQHRINSAIRMDYETFINSSFLLQGRADTFTQKTPGDRKRVLGEILGLREYDELATLARDRSRQSAGRLDLVREQIVQIEVELANYSDLDETMSRVKVDLDGIVERAQKIETERSQIGERVHELKSLAQIREQSAKRKSRQEDEQSKLEESIQKTRQEITDLDAVIARADEIESGYRSLQAARLAVQEHNVKLQQLGPLQARRSQLQSDIQAERESILQVVRVNEERQSSISKRLQELKQVRFEIESVKKERAKNESHLRELESAETEREQRAAELSGLVAKNRALRDEMHEIQARIESLRDGGATCPVCRRPLSEHDHEEIKEHWTADGKALGDAYRSNKTKIKQLEENVSELETKVKEARELSKTLAGLDARCKEMERQLTAQADLEQRLQESTTAIERAKHALKNEDFAAERREELCQVDKAIRELAYDPQAHASASEELKKVEHFDEEHRQLSIARTKRGGLTESLKDSERRHKSIVDEISQLQSELDTLDKQLANLPELERSYQAITTEAETIARRRQELEQESARLAAQKEYLERRKDEQRTLRSEEKELATNVDAYRELTTAFGRNGIQTTIIESVIPDLQDEANDLLRRMSSNYLEVTLSTSRQAQTRDRLIDTLDIIIHDEQGQRPYEMYSGGEAFRINFAIRIALSKLLARRAGATIDLLVVDEGFGTQDAQGRDGLIEALRSVEPAFAMILVITHIDEVRDMFPNRIEVVKTARGSRVTVK